MAGIVDLKEQYEILEIKEEKNETTIAKHCINSDCTTFGLITTDTDKFLQVFPEFEIKRKNVTINGIIMDIIERGGIRKGEKCPICLEPLDYVSKNFISTPCRHSFHFRCLIKSMARNHLCPICRTELGFKCNKVDISDLLKDASENSDLNAMRDLVLRFGEFDNDSLQEILNDSLKNMRLDILEWLDTQHIILTEPYHSDVVERSNKCCW